MYIFFSKCMGITDVLTIWILWVSHQSQHTFINSKCDTNKRFVSRNISGKNLSKINKAFGYNGAAYSIHSLRRHFDTLKVKCLRLKACEVSLSYAIHPHHIHYPNGTFVSSPFLPVSHIGVFIDNLKRLFTTYTVAFSELSQVFPCFVSRDALPNEIMFCSEMKIRSNSLFFFGDLFQELLMVFWHFGSKYCNSYK